MREATYHNKETNKRGFLMAFDKLIKNQGEGAFIIEKEGNSLTIVGYTLPKEGNMFGQEELWNTFLAQAVESIYFKDNEHKVLTAYLESKVVSHEQERLRIIRSTNMMGGDVRGIYKYKPVDKKVKLVIQELPAEFWIIREIIGDLLKDMPTLSHNPPDFEPTARYTVAQKNVPMFACF